MSAVLRVAAPTAPKRAAGAPARPLLTEEGAAVILGASVTDVAAVVPVAPGTQSLFGPRGVAVAADGSLWVADTGHHRVLGWSSPPDTDGSAADILIGQPDFFHEGRNAKRDPGAATVNVPTGITACGKGLAVADAWNHRVLIWRRRPARHNQPADVVLGQPDFNSTAANRGNERPDADTLFWPYGVAWDGKNLWVADTGNRRLLCWDGLPERNGQLADRVLGQSDFRCRDENGGALPNAASMRWPHGISFLGPHLCVADAGNNRVMVWHSLPSFNGQPCDAVLGQRDMSGVDHNRGEYWPGADTLNMPYAVGAAHDWLIVADTANSRLLAWHVSDIQGCGAPARRLAAQPDWQSKGDNRWQPAARDSLCWPYGLCATSGYLAIADSGNNRVLLWRWSSDISGVAR